MSQRLPNNTRWLWCVLLALWGPKWVSVTAVAVKVPPKTPATIEAQAKFFQDFFSVQLSPYKIEFGHVCEDPNNWEQRYEKKDFKNHRDMGKVRWGDKQGGYGEHYWDLNHAGHADNHGHDHEDYNHNRDDDDGSYHGHDDEGSYKSNDDEGSYKVNDDPYDEPSEQNPTYATDYDPKSAQYEEGNRAKRAHPKVKVSEERDDVRAPRRKTKDDRDEQSHTQRKPTKQKRHKPREQNFEEDLEEREVPPRELSRNQQSDSSSQSTARVLPEQKQFVPYEGGAGVRQYQAPEITPAASVPRLFLEPATGHVVDRATGQAYILQPIVANYN